MKPGDEVGVKNQGGANWNEDQMPTGPRSSTSSSSDGDSEMNRKFGAASTFRRTDLN